jgi:hypothetical protein
MLFGDLVVSPRRYLDAKLVSFEHISGMMLRESEWYNTDAAGYTEKFVRGTASVSKPPTRRRQS